MELQQPKFKIEDMVYILENNQLYEGKIVGIINKIEYTLNNKGKVDGFMPKMYYEVEINKVNYHYYERCDFSQIKKEESEIFSSKSGLVDMPVINYK